MSKSKKPEMLADALRRHIRGSGMTMYAVAKAAGIDPGAVGRFMADKRDLSLKSAGKVAVALGLRIVKGG